VKPSASSYGQVRLLYTCALTRVMNGCLLGAESLCSCIVSFLYMFPALWLRSTLGEYANCAKRTCCCVKMQLSA